MLVALQTSKMFNSFAWIYIILGWVTFFFRIRLYASDLPEIPWLITLIWSQRTFANIHLFHIYRAAIDFFRPTLLHMCYCYFSLIFLFLLLFFRIFLYCIAMLSFLWALCFNKVLNWIFYGFKLISKTIDFQLKHNRFSYQLPLLSFIDFFFSLFCHMYLVLPIWNWTKQWQRGSDRECRGRHRHRHRYIYRERFSVFVWKRRKGRYVCIPYIIRLPTTSGRDLAPSWFKLTAVLLSLWSS